MPKNKEVDRLKAVADSLKVYDPMVHGQVNPYKDKQGIVNKEYQQNQILYDEIKDVVSDEIINAEEIQYNKELNQQAEMDTLDTMPDPIHGKPWNELTGAPDKPSDPNFHEEMQEEQDRIDKMLSDPILEEAGLKLGENFGLLDALNGITEEGLEFTPFETEKGEE